MSSLIDHVGSSRNSTCQLYRNERQKVSDSIHLPEPPQLRLVQTHPRTLQRVLVFAVMSWLTNVALYVIHVVYIFVNSLSLLRGSFTRRIPEPLGATRGQTPNHLALVFNTGDYASKHSLEHLDDFLVENVERVVSWCRLSGVSRLTVYDRKGMRSLGLLLLQLRGD